MTPEDQRVVWWCVQARERGLLVGDICMARRVALDVALKVERQRRIEIEDGIVRAIDALGDMWLAFEHGEAWMKIRAEREAQEIAERESESGMNLAAPDMASMLEMLRGMAAMEGNQTSG